MRNIARGTKLPRIILLRIQSMSPLNCAHTTGTTIGSLSSSCKKPHYGIFKFTGSLLTAENKASTINKTLQHQKHIINQFIGMRAPLNFAHISIDVN